MITNRVILSSLFVICILTQKKIKGKLTTFQFGAKFSVNLEEGNKSNSAVGINLHRVNKFKKRMIDKHLKHLYNLKRVGLINIGT